MTTPKISIVIPTRNRPELLRYALKSLDRTDNNRVEVIVVDNPTGRPAKYVFDDFSRHNWKYHCASTPLSMCDNWEFGLQCATGDYVAFMTDKMTFLDGAMEHICRFLDTHDTDIISWRTEFYSGSDSDFKNGCFKPAWRVERPVGFDPQEALHALVSFLTPTGQEGRRYYWGKICYGAYSRDLVQRIVSRYGRMFEQLSPDFTSTIAALSLAKSAVDIGSPMMMAFILPAVSNGMLTTRSTEATKGFYNSIDNSDYYRERLPVKSLYMSTHNSLLSDYRAMAAKGAFNPIEDEGFEDRFALRIARDLDQIFWDNVNELNAARGELKKILDSRGIDGSIYSEIIDGKKKIGFQQQIDSLRDSAIDIESNKKYKHTDINSANVKASEFYLNGNEIIFGDIYYFDSKEIDNCRRKLGPYKTLLLDLFLLQSMQDKKTERLASILMEITGNLDLDGSRILEVSPVRDNFTLIAFQLLKWMREENVPHLFELMWTKLNDYSLSTSDLTSTTLLGIPDPGRVIDEEICSFVRQGLNINCFQSYMGRPDQVPITDFLALFMSLNRYGSTGESHFRTFCDHYEVNSIGSECAHILSFWAQEPAALAVTSAIVTEPERWLIRAKHLYAISDWDGLHQEAILARDIELLNPLIVEIYLTFARFNGLHDDTSSILELRNRHQDDIESFYLEWMILLDQILGDAAKAQGDYDNSRKYYGSALFLARECFGVNDWRTMAYITNLVGLELILDKKKAHEYQKTLYKLSADVFGDDNPSTIQHLSLLKQIEDTLD